MAEKRSASRVAMDKRLVVHVPVELAERIASRARSNMTTSSEFTRQALLAALAEADVTANQRQGDGVSAAPDGGIPPNGRATQQWAS